MKTDREEQFLEITRSICPVCHRLVDAEIQVKNNRVLMHKRCPEHGWFASLVSSDFGNYQTSQKYNKPGTLPLHFASEVKNGCPEDCGLCPEHKQHTCLGIIEVTDVCNLQCPICFADASGKSFLTIEQISDMLDLYVKCEGQPEVVQFSGGEPTLHPDLFEMLELVPLKVTYHDPCHLGRHNKIYEAPRRVLQSIPGIELVEMDRIRQNSRCCGMGGGLKMGFPQIQLKMSAERIKEAESTRATDVTTPCPTCYLGLQDGITEAKSDMRVRHLIELVSISVYKN
ncbi:MAG: (Fe-S)-binding protein [Eubacteriales bacterium]